ncbi:hypothetical protein T265_10948 [Opisthorchis viverrini]|uniref:Uncharacterized protein n=1 Tax=Opisthorchis viverrini TaxID=6198 RepID=A0A074ZZB4_OPIVI|nr:hypothetical protein T265_10948 [Opisthorchis viverrini]KER20519.1 hypothetical protein T265_10948 [Opisthorchis viverrini]
MSANNNQNRRVQETYVSRHGLNNPHLLDVSEGGIENKTEMLDSIHELILLREEAEARYARRSLSVNQRQTTVDVLKPDGNCLYSPMARIAILEGSELWHSTVRLSFGEVTDDIHARSKLSVLASGGGCARRCGEIANQSA